MKTYLIKNNRVWDIVDRPVSVSGDMVMLEWLWQYEETFGLGRYILTWSQDPVYVKKNYSRLDKP